VKNQEFAHDVGSTTGDGGKRVNTAAVPVVPIVQNVPNVQN
jgi:hypothetical protein